LEDGRWKMEDGRSIIIYDVCNERKAKEWFTLLSPWDLFQGLMDVIKTQPRSG
jgi:hypothetical protein